MKLIRWLTLVLALSLFIAAPLSAAEQKVPAGNPQTVCPVLGGNIDKQFYVDYKGKRVYFCCQGCDAEFKKNPEKYMKKIEEQGITLEKCPVQKPQK